MMKALDGIRVIDMSTFMSGPFATMVLGDLGADVIKIEQTGVGDASRLIPPHFHEGESLYYISLNRNKKSVTLDLNTDKGKEILYGLVGNADIFVDNFRPGISEKLGITYDRLKEINPQIICCSITAFGPDGPYGDLPAYDLTIQAMSGTMSMTGEMEGSSPLRLGVPMGDLASSMWLLVGILSALYHREKTGNGQRLDVSLLDSLVALNTYPALYYSYAGEISKPLGSGHQSVVPFAAYKTKDYYITVSCGTEKFWHLFCDALELEQLKTDPRFLKMGDRLKNKGELNEILHDVFARKSNAEWLDILNKAGVPCGPVNTIDKVFEDPALLHRDMIISVDHSGTPLRSFGNPIKMSETPITEYKTPPRLGADNDEVLSTYLGYSAETIEKLKEDGVIS